MMNLLVLRRYDVGCAGDARGLHVALDVGFEGADLEVAVHLDITVLGPL